MTHAVQDDEDFLARSRARQIEMVVRFTPLTTLTNLLNVTLVCGLFFDTDWFVPTLIWGALVMTLVGLGARPWWRTLRGHRLVTRRTAAAELRTIRHAAALALVWAVMPTALLPAASPGQQGIIGCVCIGMLCAGGFALGTVPTAGILFPAILGAGILLGLARSDGLPVGLLACALTIYISIVAMSVRRAFQSFRARLEAEAAAERQRDLVGLLLDDFEAHASDALWEADAQGCLRHVSPRLCKMLGGTPETLVGRPLLELFDAAQDVSDEWVDLQGDEPALAERLRRGLPFHGVVLPLRPGVGTRASGGWIKLTARPLTGPHGEALGWRGVLSDVTQAHEAQRHVAQLAFKDVVTGLHNRYGFNIRLTQMVAQEGAVQPCAVICMDLDGFKLVNDALGHAMGDGLLRSVAERLSRLMHPTDLFARLGGDEFGFILDGVTERDHAAQRAAALLQAMAAPMEVSGATVPIGASLGVALVPADGSHAEAILQNADLALYAAKDAGRGQYRFFEPHMGARVQRRLSIERALRDALREDQLSLVYQPQLDLRSGLVLGFEALLRWHHPVLGHVSPADFVPVAEDAGLIADIGIWVLKRACRDATHWPAHLTVAVNLSPLQVMAQDVGAAVRAALTDVGLAAHRLELEVTESVLMNEAPATLAQLHAVHELGARIALDDFGTGYSSMAYLRRFPFDKLKIDRSFVRELADGDARAIVQAMLDVAAALRMDTVAEGVESHDELIALRELGCRAAQGFYVARPMAPDQVPRFLTGWIDHPAARTLAAMPRADATDPILADTVQQGWPA